MEIPRCEGCGRNEYRCSIDGKYVCCLCARFVLIARSHHQVFQRQNRNQNPHKMEQDPKERTLFEALEDLTGCPLPKKIDLETEWKQKKRIQAPEAFNVAPLYSTRFLAQI